MAFNHYFQFHHCSFASLLAWAFLASSAAADICHHPRSVMPEIPKAIAVVTLFIATTSLSFGVTGAVTFFAEPAPPPAPPQAPQPPPSMPLSPVAPAECDDDPNW